MAPSPLPFTSKTSLPIAGGLVASLNAQEVAVLPLQRCHLQQRADVSLIKELSVSRLAHRRHDVGVEWSEADAPAQLGNSLHVSGCAKAFDQIC